jgi:hypothetical protein
MPALAPFPALALQCAMCYQTAAQAAQGLRALNTGILILLLPPLAIIGCISWVAYQRRDEPGAARDAAARSERDLPQREP